MIKARGVFGGQEAIVLGLERENMRRLLDGQPIMFDGAQVGLPGIRILILGGETLSDVKEDMRACGIPAPSRE
jgi:hypothetical protein